MALALGKKLGPYEIQSPLGAGGMGEVYRARDTRLERGVAVKVLPAHLSDRPEAGERFEREARTISSLNHPNICHLHDVGEQDGVRYLVMELLEGETLADRLRRGPMLPEQVLRYGAEIAVGLDAAHRRGVVHRDLKPGNVMLTKTGAKLMDFGLAKEMSTVKPVSAELTATMTGSHATPLTQQGTIVGTFQSSVLTARWILIPRSATTAKKAPLPDPLYVYCTKDFSHRVEAELFPVRPVWKKMPRPLGAGPFAKER